MALAKEEKQKILEKFKTADNDTGSPEVQIALLTENINKLQAHFKEHKNCLLYTSPSPRDYAASRMPSSA